MLTLFFPLSAFFVPSLCEKEDKKKVVLYLLYVTLVVVVFTFLCVCVIAGTRSNRA